MTCLRSLSGRARMEAQIVGVGAHPRQSVAVAAAASTGNVLERQIPGFCSRSMDSETLGMRCSDVGGTMPSRGI